MLSNGVMWCISMSDVESQKLKCFRTFKENHEEFEI